jgi:hypothetical protein
MSKYSAEPLCGGPVIETEHSPEPLTPMYLGTRRFHSGDGSDQPVPKALMIALQVIVRHELANRPT